MKVISFASSTLCPSNRLFTTNSSQGIRQQTKLSEAETNILEFLLEHPGEYFSKGHLLIIGWNNRPISGNSLPVAITNLRKINCNHDFLIENLTKVGYMLILKQGANISISNEQKNKEELTTELQPQVINNTPTSATKLNKNWKSIYKNLFVLAISATNIISLLFLLFVLGDWINISCTKLNDDVFYCYTSPSPAPPSISNITHSGVSVFAKAGHVEKQVFLSRGEE